MNSSTMVWLNGAQESLGKGQTIASLLLAKKINPASVVVELNTEIVQKEAYGTTVLKNSDSVEVLHFVGGG